MRHFQEILEPEPAFVFLLQYCNDKEKALEAAKVITRKLKERGKQTYSKVFENVELLTKYSEHL